MNGTWRGRGDSASPWRGTLRGNVAWAVVGYGVYAGCQWGMLIGLAKLGDPELVGRFALGLAVTAPVFMFANLHLQAVTRTDAQQTFRPGDYLGLRIITTILALMLIALVVVVVDYRPETALVVLAVAAAKAIEAISNVLHGILQQHERMDRIAQSQMLKGPVSLAALTGGVYLTGDLLWGILALAVTWLAILVGFDLPVVSSVLSAERGRDSAAPTTAAGRIEGGARVRPLWEKRVLLRLAWVALPLGIVTLLTSLNVNVPRYFVERHLGEHQLGIYAALAYVMVAGSLVMQAAGESASAQLARAHAMGNHAAFRALLFKLVAFGAACGLVGFVVTVVAGRRLLSVVYSEQYAVYGEVFIWLAAAAALDFVAAFLIYGLTAARRFRVQTPLAAGAVATMAIACAFLVPTFGLRGAAIAAVAASAFHALGAAAVMFGVLAAPAGAEARMPISPGRAGGRFPSPVPQIPGRRGR